jgi:hypothetical protein
MKDEKQELGASPVSAGRTVTDGVVFSGLSRATDDILLPF